MNLKRINKVAREENMFTLCDATENTPLLEKSSTLNQPSKRLSSMLPY